MADGSNKPKDSGSIWTKMNTEYITPAMENLASGFTDPNYDKKYPKEKIDRTLDTDKTNKFIKGFEGR